MAPYWEEISLCSVAGLVCHMRDIQCLSCLKKVPVGSFMEEACLRNEKADTPRKPGDAGAGGYPAGELSPGGGRGG